MPFLFRRVNREYRQLDYTYQIVSVNIRKKKNSVITRQLYTVLKGLLNSGRFSKLFWGWGF